MRSLQNQLRTSKTGSNASQSALMDAESEAQQRLFAQEKLVNELQGGVKEGDSKNGELERLLREQGERLKEMDS